MHQILGAQLRARNEPSWLCLTAEARHPSPLPLGLHRAADHFPRARWEPSNEHLVVMSGDTVVGSLKKATGGTVVDRWSWAITCVLIDPGENPRNP